MKYIVFRVTKHNRYSLIPLLDALKKENFDVDFAYTKEELINKSGPDSIVCFSFMSMQVRDIIKEIHSLHPKTKIIVGGPHVSARPHDFLSIADAVVIGEGEHVIAQVVKDIISNRSRSVYYGSKVKEITYSLENSPYTAPIEISRGCPFACKFCQVSYIFGRKPRYRPLKSILKEAQHLLKRGKTFIRFISPNGLGYMSPDGKSPNTKALLELVRRLKDIGIREIFIGSFPSEVRPEFIKEETAAIIKNYCSNKRVVIGVQSASNRLLTILRRGHTKEDVITALHILKDYDIEPHLDFIFGFPEETQEDIKESLEFIYFAARNFNARIHAHTFMPLPQTPYEKAKPKQIPLWLKRNLHDLEKSGIVYGSWSIQQKIGKTLWKSLTA